MKKILYVPWFCYKKDDIPSIIWDYEIHFFDDFDKLSTLSLDDYEYFIGHSLGCLYLWEYLEKMNLFEKYRSKAIIYNPIVETNPLRISLKRANNIKLFTTRKWLKLVLRFFWYFIIRPKYLFLISKKIILWNIEKHISLYEKFNYNYLSLNDEFSWRYRERFNNIFYIWWKHDEIYFDSKVFEKILSNLR
jgi:hypothetical protein